MNQNTLIKFIAVSIFCLMAVAFSTNRSAVSTAAPNAAPSAPLTYRPGAGLNFDGNDYLDVPDSIDMNGSTTVDVWIRSVRQIGICIDEPVGSCEANEPRVGIILGNFGSPGEGIVNFELHKYGRPRIYWNNGEVDLTSDTKLRDGKWHHIAFVRDTTADKIQIYIDGVLDEEVNNAGSDYTGNDPEFRIGADYRASDPQYFGWFMDELKVWKRALSAEDIARLAEGRQPTVVNNLEIYYTFDEVDPADGLITNDAGSDAWKAHFPFDIDQYPEPQNFNRMVTKIGDETAVSAWDGCLPNDCTLREAVAEDIPGTDDITFNPSLAGQTITLDLKSNITIDNPVNISGEGAPMLEISGGDETRIFRVETGVLAEISHLTLAEGNAGTGWGGAIRVASDAVLKLDSVTITNNQAQRGGGINNHGDLTVFNSTLSGNMADQTGGAIYQVKVGGSDPSSFVSFTTMSGNSAGPGFGAGLRLAEADSGAATFLATIMDSGQSCTATGNGTITSLGHNVFFDGGANNDCNPTSNDSTADPLLEPLANNGGNSRTHAIPTNSAAVDAMPSSNSICGLSAPDQRGETRPVDGNGGDNGCDAGSYEFQPGSFTSCTSGNIIGVPVDECQALVDLYNSTNGSGWPASFDWLASNFPCEWFGVTCAGGHVTKVDLFDNNLTGQLPPSLNDLTQVILLEFSRNDLSGSLPNLTGLDKLRTFGVFDNSFSGPIPASYGNLTSLGLLQVTSNQLAGSIPAELGNLPNLAHLFVSNNSLMGGVIPPAFNGGVMNSLVITGTHICEPAGFDSSNITNFTGTGLACPTVKMSTPNVTVAENGGNAELTVQLSVTSTLPISVTYSSGGGTYSGSELASAGSDYTPAAGRALVIPAGESSVTLSIPILDDGTDEQNEHFVVELSLADNPAGATLVPLQNATTVQITDNDEPGSTNSAPTANGQSVTTGRGQAKVITLTGSDPDSGDVLSYIIVSQPSSGTLSGTAPNVTYTPNAGFSGDDSFTYKVNDGMVDSPTATVSITVAAGPIATDSLIFLPIVVR